MKLSHLNSALKLYSPFGFGARNVSGVSLYSTAGTELRFWDGKMRILYRRISPNPRPVSIVPVLDQWIQEGQRLNKPDLIVIINTLRHYKRYNHALQVSKWMADKILYPLTYNDFAIRLDLISKVHGTEEAENYFNNIPVQMKVARVYIALLNCYTYAKQVENAEAVVQQMKDLGFTSLALPYSNLLNLYYQIGNRKKIDALMQEMDEKGIRYNNFTYGILLSAYVADSDVKGIDNVLTKMESDSEVVFDWLTYSIAANGYIKAGLVDKSFAAVKKSEGLMLTAKKRSTALECLLTQYAAIGRKDEVMRLWDFYKVKHKVHNRGYISMIIALLKFDDIESAEKIFEEWESKKSYDIHIPNCLIGCYCRKGLLEKAETLVDWVRAKNLKPNAKTWYHLTTGYCMHDQIHRAVEAFKEEILVAEPWWKLRKDNLVACLEFLKGKGDVKGAEEIIRLLNEKGYVSLDFQEQLLNKIREGEPISQTLREDMQGLGERWN